jgi:hypothetical protein
MEKNLFLSIPQRKKPLSLYLATEKNLFRCIPQRKKTSPLYPTLEGNIFHCGIQQKKTCVVVGYNAEDFSVLDPTCCIVGYSTPHEILLWCRILWKKTPALWDTIETKLLAILRFFSVVSQNGKNLFRCIPQWRKTFSVVSHNGKKLFCSIPQRKKTLPLNPTTGQNSKLK